MTASDYRRIPLRSRHNKLLAWTLVDEADYRDVGSYTWSLSTGGYAVRRKQEDGGRLVYLHRELLGLVRGDRDHVDHMNRDKLDNRRQNLRLGDQRMNVQNCGAQRGSTSKYRGVHLSGKRWVAQAGKRDDAGVERNNYLGTYGDERDAAAIAAQWRAENLPGSIEDPELLRREVTR